MQHQKKQQVAAAEGAGAAGGGGGDGGGGVVGKEVVGHKQTTRGEGGQAEEGAWSIFNIQSRQGWEGFAMKAAVAVRAGARQEERGQHCFTGEGNRGACREGRSNRQQV